MNDKPERNKSNPDARKNDKSTRTIVAVVLILSLFVLSLVFVDHDTFSKTIGALFVIIFYIFVIGWRAMPRVWRMFRYEDLRDFRKYADGDISMEELTEKYPQEEINEKLYEIEAFGEKWDKGNWIFLLFCFIAGIVISFVYGYYLTN